MYLTFKIKALSFIQAMLFKHLKTLWEKDAMYVLKMYTCTYTKKTHKPY